MEDFTAEAREGAAHVIQALGINCLNNIAFADLVADRIVDRFPGLGSKRVLVRRFAMLEQLRLIKLHRSEL